MRLHQLSIRDRVTILVLVPLLALLGVSAFAATVTTSAAVALVAATASQNSVVSPVRPYLAVLQGERILATTYLAAPTAQDRSALNAQERRSDAALAALRTAASSSAFRSAAAPAVQAAMAATLQDAAGLAALRQKIPSLAVSRADAQAAYTRVITEGLHAIALAILKQPDVPLVSQSLGLLEVAQAEDFLLQSQALLVGDVMAGHFPAADHVQFAQLVGTYRGLLVPAMSDVDPESSASYLRVVSASSLAALRANENTVINSPSGALPGIHLASYDRAAQAVAAGLVVTGNVDGLKLADSRHQAARSISLRLILVSGLGLLIFLVSLAVSLSIGRRLVRQLAELRDDALELARQRLPRAMASLSASDHPDVQAEGPLLAARTDEIGQVRKAFNSVQRSTIEAVVSRARLRSATSAVFRTVARRGQVLLHQQLALLDALEQRATESAEREGIARISRLTTRMRRQAAGLIVLAGDRTEQSWTEPVPLTDVLRGAAAQVVDYARIRVVCTSRAELQGQAAADAIHLIAELAENATVFSPPHTPVRIVGHMVARGFAVEIEDCGPGLSLGKMAEINAAFLDPLPDFPASEQLGLYVAACLAQRYGIRVTLRSSPLGGVTAIVLMPMELIVTPPAAPPPAERGSAVPLGSPAVGDGFLATESDLPRRIRQANLAPELCEPPSPETADGNGKRKSRHSLDEIRDVLAALQRWERSWGDDANQPPL